MRSNFEASIFNWKNSRENINTIYCSLDKFAYLGQAKICGINHKRGKSDYLYLLLGPNIIDFR